jgi:GTP cyclohydrolase II
VVRLIHKQGVFPGAFSMGDAADSLFDSYRSRADSHLRRSGRPLVTLSYAQSLDGSIAARRGETLALSGPESKRLTHRLRAASDAILVGIGTVLADDPRLTARLAGDEHPQPVVVDSRLRFPLNARLLDHPTHKPWIASSERADPARAQALEAAGAVVLRLPEQDDGRVDLGALLDRLGERGIASLMVEGGAAIITSFLAGRLADQLVLAIAPRLVGGLGAVERLLTDEAHLCDTLSWQAGPDMIVWGQFERDG